MDLLGLIISQFGFISKCQALTRQTVPEEWHLTHPLPSRLPSTVTVQWGQGAGDLEMSSLEGSGLPPLLPSSTPSRRFASPALLDLIQRLALFPGSPTAINQKHLQVCMGAFFPTSICTLQGTPPHCLGLPMLPAMQTLRPSALFRNILSLSPHPAPQPFPLHRSFLHT